jgi:hypothetical protein
MLHIPWIFPSALAEEDTSSLGTDRSAARIILKWIFGKDCEGANRTYPPKNRFERRAW